MRATGERNVDDAIAAICKKHVEFRTKSEALSRLPRSMDRFRQLVGLVQSISNLEPEGERIVLMMTGWYLELVKLLEARPKDDDLYTDDEILEIVRLLEKIYPDSFIRKTKDECKEMVFRRSNDGSWGYYPAFLFRINNDRESFIKDNEEKLAFYREHHAMLVIGEDESDSEDSGRNFSEKYHRRLAEIINTVDDVQAREEKLSQLRYDTVREYLTDEQQLTELQKVQAEIIQYERKETGLLSKLAKENTSAAKKYKQEIDSLEVEIKNRRSYIDFVALGMQCWIGADVKPIIYELIGSKMPKTPKPIKEINVQRPPEIEVHDGGHFEYSKDLSHIRVIKLKDTEDQEYWKLTAPKARKVIKILLDAARKRKKGGWVRSEKYWRGAFQKDDCKRFKTEQIEIGDNLTELMGHWRLKNY